MADWEFQSLSDAHDRSRFDCGVPVLNDWLKQRAGPNAAAGVYGLPNAFALHNERSVERVPDEKNGGCEESFVEWQANAYAYFWRRILDIRW